MEQRLGRVSSPTQATPQNADVKHAVNAVPNGCEQSMAARSSEIESRVYGSRGICLKEGDVKAIAAFKIDSIWILLIDQDMPWMMCQARTPWK